MIGSQIVYRLSDDGLTQESWVFSVIDFKIVLSQYTKITKPTKRHGFAWKFGMPLWDRHRTRENNISELEIPFPDDVKNEVKRNVISQIEVIKSCDWKR